MAEPSKAAVRSLLNFHPRIRSGGAEAVQIHFLPASKPTGKPWQRERAHGCLPRALSDAGGHCGEKPGQALSDIHVAAWTPDPDHSSIPKLGGNISSSLLSNRQSRL